MVSVHTSHTFPTHFKAPIGHSPPPQIKLRQETIDWARLIPQSNFRLPTPATHWRHRGYPFIRLATWRTRIGKW